MIVIIELEHGKILTLFQDLKDNWGLHMNDSHTNHFSSSKALTSNSICFIVPLTTLCAVLSKNLTESTLPKLWNFYWWFVRGCLTWLNL